MTATIKHPPPPADEEDLPDESESDDEDFRVDGEDDAASNSGASSDAGADGDRDANADTLEPGEAETVPTEHEEEEPLRKRLRRSAKGEDQKPATSIASATPSTNVDAIWSEFKNAPSEKGSGGSSAGDMVRVVQTYRFAGEEVRTEKLLPASHPDAIAYLRTQEKAQEQHQNSCPPSSTPASASPAPQSSSAGAAASPQTQNGKPASSSSSSPQPSEPLPNPAPPAPAPAPAPVLVPTPKAASTSKLGPRRKKGSSLAALSAAASSKPPKLNTLEKSKLDWELYKSRTGAAPPSSASALSGQGAGAGAAGGTGGAGQGLTEREREEMEAQTRAGAAGLGTMAGYLERKEFLERVEKRAGGGGPGAKRG